MMLHATSFTKIISHKRLFRINAMADEKKSSSIFDSLSGKALIDADKAQKPNLYKVFKLTDKNVKTSNVKISEKGKLAIELLRKKYPAERIKVGTPIYGITDSQLMSQYNELVNIFDNEEELLVVIKLLPNILIGDLNRVRANYNIYVDKWGIDKAKGVIFRNPALLSVPPTGYGSAEKAGDETVVLSYAIAATRPIGGLLLGALFLALSKPFIAQYILNQN